MGSSSCRKWPERKRKLLRVSEGSSYRELTVLVKKIRSCLALRNVGGAVASWLVRSSADRAVRVQVVAGDIVLCSWAKHVTLTVPLSTQGYKWVLANLMLRGNPAMD